MGRSEEKLRKLNLSWLLDGPKWVGLWALVDKFEEGKSAIDLREKRSLPNETYFFIFGRPAASKIIYVRSVGGPESTSNKGDTTNINNFVRPPPSKCLINHCVCSALIFADFLGVRGRRAWETLFRHFGDFGPRGPKRPLKVVKKGSQT